MNWAWHASNSPSNTREVGAFAKARAEAQVKASVMRGQAVRIVAHQSADADDCRRLLSMLGLDEEVHDPDAVRLSPPQRYTDQYGRRVNN